MRKLFALVWALNFSTQKKDLIRPIGHRRTLTIPVAFRCQQFYIHPAYSLFGYLYPPKPLDGGSLSFAQPINFIKYHSIHLSISIFHLITFFLLKLDIMYNFLFNRQIKNFRRTIRMDVQDTKKISYFTIFIYTKESRYES